MPKRVSERPPLSPDEKAHAFEKFGKQFARPDNRAVVSDDHPDNPPSSAGMHNDTWIVALEDLDDRGDREPLARLLESGFSLNEKVRHLLADLVRRGIAKPPGRPRTPAYRASGIETKLAFAHGAVAELIEGGNTVGESIAIVAKDRSIEENLLNNSYNGRRGSALRRRINAKKTKARPAD